MKQEVVTVGLDLAKSVFFRCTRWVATEPFWYGASYGAQS